jgi:predicted nucleic acid-binding protein
MRVLLDTNVILDALLDREPWVTEARAIWAAHLQFQVAAHVTATSLTDVFYVARRIAGGERAWLAVGACLDQLYIIPVGPTELRSAAGQGHGDFEDHLQIALALANEVDAIVTRDPVGFVGSPITILTPTQFVEQMRKEAKGGA